MTPLATHAFEPSTDKVQDRMSRALNLIHENTTEPPSVERLAEEAALSVGAFHRLFKRHTGQTVLDYIAQLRIGIACQLLIATERPIKLIAVEAGYNNAAHFNRQFPKAIIFAPAMHFVAASQPLLRSFSAMAISRDGPSELRSLR